MKGWDIYLYVRVLLFISWRQTNLILKSRTKDIREQVLTDGTQVYETGPVRDETTEG